MRKNLYAISRHAEARRLRRWKAAKNLRPGPERDAAMASHDEAQRLCERLWEREGPDPILSQLARAQEAEDARPNPDDPDDEGDGSLEEDTDDIDL